MDGEADVRLFGLGSGPTADRPAGQHVVHGAPKLSAERNEKRILLTGFYAPEKTVESGREIHGNPCFSHRYRTASNVSEKVFRHRVSPDTV